METLFAVSVIGLFTSSYLLGISDTSGRRTLRVISLLLVFVFTIVIVIVGISGINGVFAKDIRCKEYQVDKIENIKVVNNDTTKTVHYIIHDIKR